MSHFGFQNADGQNGNTSGRRKMQNVEAQRNSEEVRKQRVNALKHFSEVQFLRHCWQSAQTNRFKHLLSLAPTPAGATENLQRSGADEEEESAQLSKRYPAATKRVWTEGKYQASHWEFIYLLSMCTIADSTVVSCYFSSSQETDMESLEKNVNFENENSRKAYYREFKKVSTCSYCKHAFANSH